MDHGLIVKLIWDDEHLVEFECTVVTGVFRGPATCYAAHEALPAIADSLRQFVRDFEGAATFGAEDGTKGVTIDIRAVDHAKHVVAAVKLVTGRGVRPDDVARLEVQFPIEPAAIDTFLRELGTVRGRGNYAFLRAVG
jgi:hypothetical protein